MNVDRKADDSLEKSAPSKEEGELIDKASAPAAKEPMDQDEVKEPAQSGFPVGNEIDFGTSME